MAMREFLTGATRNDSEQKPDYEGYLSPLVTKRFGAYMTHHRMQVDGKLRASDNWQLGIPKDAYIKSLTRHAEDLKLHHRGFGDEATESLEESLCAILFNAQGYLFEVLREQRQVILPQKSVHEPASLPQSLKQQDQRQAFPVVELPQSSFGGSSSLSHVCLEKERSLHKL